MKMKARRRRPPLVAPPCAVLALFVLWGAVLLSLVDAPSLSLPKCTLRPPPALLPGPLSPWCVQSRMTITYWLA